MELITGIGVLMLLPLLLFARRQLAGTAQARRRNDGDSSGAGADVIIDPSSCDSGDADGGSGCGGGCGGCGS